jgi:hypothetical protein
MRPALDALKRATLASQSVNAEPSFAPETLKGARTRGVKGREEAQGRGLILSGNGPHGGVGNAGRNVVLYGLPGRLMPNHLREYLRGFSFSPKDSEKTQVEKVQGCAFDIAHILTSLTN